MLTLSEIKVICSDYGIIPSKSRGQNFLFDQNIVTKIIESANLQKNDLILEIGPGLGVLTGDLLDKSGQVVAVELDKKVIDYLKKEYSKNEKLKLIEGDILKINPTDLNLEGDYKIVANLPYNITSNFIRKFLEAEHKPTEIILMLQKEVTKRIVAKPGEMSMLAVSVQFYAQPEILFEVSRNSFWPSPKVDSAVIRMKMKDKMPDIDPVEFFRIVKIGFSAKRKQLQNNLANGLHLANIEIKEIIKKVGLNEKIRPQDLSLENWIELVKILEK